MTAALAFLATAFPFPFERSRFRRLVAIAGILAGIGSLSLSFLPASGFVEFCRAVLDGGNIATLVLLWGFAFASLDKRTAGKNAAMTAVLSVLLALALMAALTAAPLPSASAKTVMRIASAAFLTVNLIRFSNTSRPKERRAPSALARFYVSRALIGLSIGALSGASVNSASPLTTLAAAAAAAVLIPSFVRAKDNLYGFLPIMPLVLSGILFLPFIGEGSAALPKTAPAIIWLVWIFLSSFQLSGLKESFGVSETRLCFSEKVFVLLGWMAGIAAGEQLVSAAGIDSLALAAVYGILLFATYASFRTVYNSKEDERVEELVRAREGRFDALYDRIAEEHGLTKREREVMELLAQGYTRTYISKALFVSDGTARSHIAHVYAKLDIHKKDDLLKLVRSENRDRSG